MGCLSRREALWSFPKPGYVRQEIKLWYARALDPHVFLINQGPGRISGLNAVWTTITHKRNSEPNWLHTLNFVLCPNLSTKISRIKTVMEGWGLRGSMALWRFDMADGAKFPIDNWNGFPENSSYFSLSLRCRNTQSACNAWGHRSLLCYVDLKRILDVFWLKESYDWIVSHSLKGKFPHNCSHEKQKCLMELDD